MNSIEKALFDALSAYNPPIHIQHVIKMIYDDEGKIVDVTFNEVDHKSWIEITHEQWEQNIHLDPLIRVINNKICKVDILNESLFVKKLRPDGDLFFTDCDNILIISREKFDKSIGWRITYDS